jgi:hypothetical protein
MDLIRAQTARTVLRTALAAALPLLLLAPATATAQAGEPLRFSASLYGWFPDISGRTRFGAAPGGGDFRVDVGDLLEKLEFTFQGSFEVRQGAWGAFADVIYMSVGATRDDVRSGTVGNLGIPAGASATTEFDLKTNIWTLAGYYRAVDRADLTLDAIAGVRYLHARQSLDWTFTGNVGPIPAPGRAGGASTSIGNLDAIVGLRARVSAGFHSPWFFPLYVDAGFGQSDLTWQAMAGVGYATGWGEIVAAWRHMEYRMASDTAIETLKLDGPLVGATFRW